MSHLIWHWKKPQPSDETPLSDGTRDFHYMMPNRPSFIKRQKSTIHNLTIDMHLLLVLDRQEGSTQVDVAVVTALPKKFINMVYQRGLLARQRKLKNFGK